MKKSMESVDDCNRCEPCEQMFEDNIQEIVSDATPPTMEQHSEREREVRDGFISDESCEDKSEMGERG